MHTLAVLKAKKSARLGGRLIPPTCDILAVSSPGLEAEQPRVPCKMAKTHRAPGYWVGLFVSVCSDGVVCPHLVWGMERRILSYSVPLRRSIRSLPTSSE